MSHKIVSNSSVVHNAQTRETSPLTITVNEVNFTARTGFGPIESPQHTVQFQAVVWANYSSSNSSRLHSFGHSLPSQDWSTFTEALTLTSTGSYDQVLETALLYVSEHLEPMFGLTEDDWTVSL